MASLTKRRLVAGEINVTHKRSRKDGDSKQYRTADRGSTGSSSLKHTEDYPNMSSYKTKTKHKHKKSHVKEGCVNRTSYSGKSEPKSESDGKESKPAKLMFQDIVAPKTKYSRHMKHTRKEKHASWKERREREHIKCKKTDFRRDDQQAQTTTDSFAPPGEQTQNYSHGTPAKGKDVPAHKQNKSRGKSAAELKLVAQAEEPKNQIFLPQKVEDYSVNWKQMLQGLGQKQPNGGPGTGVQKHKKTRSRIHSEDKSTEKEPKVKPLDVWFDDVDEILIEGAEVTSQQQRCAPTTDPLVKAQSYTGVTKAVAMDCEMVGVGADGKDSIVARVSLVNQYGQEIYDSYVKPTETVTDYRTAVSGIRPEHLTTGKNLKVVQKEVSDMLQGRVLVGHAVHHDLKVLFLDHPKKQVRDTSRYKPFRKLFSGQTPSLKRLTEKLVSVHIQSGEHSSVQDAQAAMRIYTLNRKQWEKDIKDRKKVNVCIKDRKTKYKSGQNKRTKKKVNQGQEEKVQNRPK